MEILRVPVKDILDDPDFKSLVKMYEEESRIKELPACEPDRDQYIALEAAGALVAVAAYSPKLIGFMVTLTSKVPHYSQRFTVLESLFVHKDKRRTGAGIKLLREARKIAKEQQAIALGVSAPINSQLHALMASSKMVPTNVIYTEVL